MKALLALDILLREKLLCQNCLERLAELENFLWKHCQNCAVPGAEYKEANVPFWAYRLARCLRS